MIVILYEECAFAFQILFYEIKKSATSQQSLPNALTFRSADTNIHRNRFKNVSIFEFKNNNMITTENAT